MLNRLFKKIICLFALGTFLISSVKPCPAQTIPGLPAPGTMVNLSPAFNPPVLKGIKVYANDPFRFDFILDKGDLQECQSVKVSKCQSDKEKAATRLIKYFLASVTIPEQDLWVNLSPYEKDRIIPQAFGQTEMGRDLLAQDYILKQITASVLYPEEDTGRKFWRKIYAKAYEKYGTTDIPVDTFNKVWIVPEKAVVYENGPAGGAFIVESRLKVMLERDYLAQQRAQSSGPLTVSMAQKQASHKATRYPLPATSSDSADIANDVLREVIIPVLEKEVNEGRHFAQLRQVYQSLILATWYKNKIKESLLAQVYSNRKKISGVNINDPKEAERIWGQYVEAFKKGAFSLIKEEMDNRTRETLPRKYFSGGINYSRLSDMAMKTTEDAASLPQDVSRLGIVKMRADLAMGSDQTALIKYPRTMTDIRPFAPPRPGPADHSQAEASREHLEPWIPTALKVVLDQISAKVHEAYIFDSTALFERIASSGTAIQKSPLLDDFEHFHGGDCYGFVSKALSLLYSSLREMSADNPADIITPLKDDFTFELALHVDGIKASVKAYAVGALAVHPAFRPEDSRLIRFNHHAVLVKITSGGQKTDVLIDPALFVPLSVSKGRSVPAADKKSFSLSALPADFLSGYIAVNPSLKWLAEPEQAGLRHELQEKGLLLTDPFSRAHSEYVFLDEPAPRERLLNNSYLLGKTPFYKTMSVIALPKGAQRSRSILMVKLNTPTGILFTARFEDPVSGEAQKILFPQRDLERFIKETDAPASAYSSSSEQLLQVAELFGWTQGVSRADMSDSLLYKRIKSLLAGAGPYISQFADTITGSDAAMDSAIEDAEGFNTVIYAADIILQTASASEELLIKTYARIRQLKSSNVDYAIAFEYLLDPQIPLRARWKEHILQAEKLKARIHQEIPAGKVGYLHGTHDLKGNPFPDSITPRETHIQELVMSALPATIENYPFLTGNIWGKNVTEDTFKKIVAAGYFDNESTRPDLSFTEDAAAQAMVRLIASYKYIARVAVTTTEHLHPDLNAPTRRFIEAHAKQILWGITSQDMLFKEYGYPQDIIDETYDALEAKDPLDLNAVQTFLGTGADIYLTLDQAIIGRYTKEHAEGSGLFQTSGWLNHGISEQIGIHYREGMTGASPAPTLVTTLRREAAAFQRKFYAIARGNDTADALDSPSTADEAMAPSARTHQPVWAEPIQRMLAAGYSFVPEKMDDTGFVYRAINKGLFEGLVTGKFLSQFSKSPSTQRDRSEKELGIFYVSHYLREAAHFLNGERFPLDSGILVMTGSRFNQETHNGRAAIHKNVDGLYRFPFFTLAPDSKNIPYVIIGEKTRTYFDSVLRRDRPLDDREEALYQILRSGNHPRLLVWPEEFLVPQKLLEHFQRQGGILFTDNMGLPSEVFPQKAGTPGIPGAAHLQNKDRAQTGGIDLTPSRMELQTTAGDNEIRFNLSPAQMEQLMNCPGFTPVIMEILPVESLQSFLGLGRRQ
jgi:hypothetical protein